uniref:Uncharacterized protein n=1 Tax=Mycena chlorophos TaxID=658473 RepID=A0ABQ0L7P9_MYCCL|nr:predicted protein [Mycena chlorophos]
MAAPATPSSGAPSGRLPSSLAPPWAAFPIFNPSELGSMASAPPARKQPVQHHNGAHREGLSTGEATNLAY